MEHAHPKDSRKISYKLPLGAAVFAIVILIGFLTMQEPELEYAISLQEMHDIVMERNETITPTELNTILENGNEAYRLIDLRDPHAFITGHLDGAVNIPRKDLLSNDNLNLLNQDNVTNILYAETHDLACGPWMILHQLGYKNNRILLGGYDFYLNPSKKDSTINKVPAFKDELAKYDYAKIVKETAGSGISVAKRKPKKVTKKRNTKKGAQGGC